MSKMTSKSKTGKSKMGKSKLTMGPVLFNWPAEKMRDFYFRLADEAPIDTVYIGEVVCSKREPFMVSHIPEIIERLQAAGKEIVYSTLALVMTSREMKNIRDLCADSDLMIEANDISCAAMLKGSPHVIGPFINVYNEGTLSWLARNGARRIVIPGEVSRPGIVAMADAGCGTELEVQVFGRLPLAISARCYHARAHNLHKDSCQFVCEEDPDGLDLETMEGKPFLAVNGTQTLSHSVCNLMGEMSDMEAAGVSMFRLSPHNVDMVKVAQTFRAVLDNQKGFEEANEEMLGLVDMGAFSNGFYYGKSGVENIRVTVE